MHEHALGRYFGGSAYAAVTAVAAVHAAHDAADEYHPWNFSLKALNDSGWLIKKDSYWVSVFFSPNRDNDRRNGATDDSETTWSALNDDHFHRVSTISIGNIPVDDIFSNVYSP